MSTTLPLFWNLSAASRDQRIGASVKLINALEVFQSQFTTANLPSDDDEDEPDAAVESLDTLNAQDVSYSIRRLVRGLASPRECSRLGFSVALTELLSRLNTVTCSQVVSLILDASKPQGSVTGQEERDLLFAQLFGLTAVIRSGLLVRTSALPTSASIATFASTAQSASDVIAQLMAIGEKNSWLRESAWWSIALAVDALKESDAEWKDEPIDALIKAAFEENKSWFPEKVAIALKLQALQPKRDWKALLVPPFKRPDLLASSNLPVISKILKESPFADDEGSIQGGSSGSWKPQLHFVWDIIIDQLLPTDASSQNKTTGSFEEFFRVAVDESLFSTTSTLERKYWGFQVFLKALPRANPDNMPLLFTANFMRCWINHLSHNDRHLHKVALQVAAEIKTCVEKNPAMGFTLILQLTGVNGSHQFDKLTRTKTVESILASMDIDGIKNYLDLLLKQFADSPTEQSDAQAVNSRRSFIIDQLGSLVRSTAIPRADDWIQLILDWLVVHGLFSINKKSSKSSLRAVRDGPFKPPLSDALCKKCRSVLLACLADLTGQTTAIKQGEKTLKISSVASDGEFWVSRVLSTIASLEKDTKHVAFLRAEDQDDNDKRTAVGNVCTKLREAKGYDQQGPAKGVEMLLHASVLRILCQDEEEEINYDSLSPCIEAAERMFFPPKKSKKSKKSAEDIEDSSQPTPVDVFTDVILGFLEKPTSFTRVIGDHVFALLSETVQESTIDLILAQLERRDPAELLEDEETLSDGEADDMDGEDADDKEESDSADDEDEGEEEDDSNDEEADLELRQKIEQALGRADPGSEDESEDLMDDEQMMAIDEQLVEVFKLRKNTGGKDVNAQREATHYKNRVLDLVDTFFKKQPTSSLLIRFVTPLIDLIANSGTDERQLKDKTNGLLRTRMGKAKEVPSSVDSDQATSILKELHERARKAKSADMLSTLSQCSIFVSKILLQADQESIVSDTYRESLSDFITRKNSSLSPAFFQDFINRLPSVAWKLRSDYLELSTKAANPYRRCHAFHMVQLLLNQLPALDAPKETVTKFMKSLSKALTNVINDACGDNLPLTTAQMKELLKLVLLGIRQTNRVDAGHAASVWDLAAWQKNRDSIESTERFKPAPALKNLCAQICQTMDPAQSAKRKGDKKQNGDIPVQNSKADTPTKASKRKHQQENDDQHSSSKRTKAKKFKSTS